jgi:hypothetical protein
MKHIRQINSVGTNSYTVVITDTYIGDLENHPILTQFPNTFEVSEDELPEYIQYVMYSKPTVPFEVQLWRIRTVLKLMQLEAQIESAIEAMPEPSKTAATYIWKFGTTVERASQTVMLLQSALQLTNEQVDDLFIQAEAILL